MPSLLGQYSARVEQRDLIWQEGLHPEIGVLWATLLDGTAMWRWGLEEPSPEAVVWSPYVNGPSIGGLVLHMAAAEQYWLQQVATGVEVSPDDPAWAYDLNLDQYVPHWPSPPAEPYAWYVRIQDETRARMFELVRAHNRPDTVHQVGDSSATYRWILAHVAEHDAYHGGQAVLLHETFRQFRLGGPRQPLSIADI
jgi:uncharacterized damage-inducible protein DinB